MNEIHNKIEEILFFRKQELHEIIGITQGDGSLNTALENAIVSLLSLAKETEVPENDLAVDSAEEEDAMSNGLSTITTRYITEQLKSLSHN